MYKFFKHCKMHGGENITEERLSAIKSSVLSQVNQSEEDKPMKKHFSIKPLIIAAAVAVTGAASVVTANAATDGAVAEQFAKIFKYTVGDNEYTGTVTIYENVDGATITEVNVEVPDDIDGVAGFIVSEDGELGEVSVTPIGYISDIEINDDGTFVNPVWVVPDAAKED